MIQRWSSFLHVAAWGLPAAQTIAILVLMAVDADELTGTSSRFVSSRVAVGPFPSGAS